MYSVITDKTSRDPKKLFELYRRNAISPEQLNQWAKPVAEHVIRPAPRPIPTAILGKAYTLKIAKKGSREQSEALLRLADFLLKTNFYDRHPPVEMANALCEIARFQHLWVRPLEDFVPKSYNIHRMVESLYHHLLNRYPVPVFFFNSLLQPPTEVEKSKRDEVLLSQIRIGQGTSVRSDFVFKPFTLTSQGCHWFLCGPDVYSYCRAMRWAQVKSYGASDGLAHAIVCCSSKVLAHEPFWATVFQFLARQPMFDPSEARTIIDYVCHTKFFVERQPDGTIRAAQPQFEIKGRTVQSLMRAAHTWHGEMNRARSGLRKWQKSLLQHYLAESKSCDYTVTELCDSKELQLEGRAHSHCVASYAAACASGSHAIFSCQRYDKLSTERKRILTIQVDMKAKQIIQARGAFNRLPDGESEQLVKGFAYLNNLKIVGY